MRNRSRLTVAAALGAFMICLVLLISASKLSKTTDRHDTVVSIGGQAEPSDMNTAQAYKPGESISPSPVTMTFVSDDELELNMLAQQLDSYYLILVNWENPFTGETPELIMLQEVISAPNARFAGYKHINITAGKALNSMLLDAGQHGIAGFCINSAYRRFDEQEVLWNGALNRDPDYGKDPYSEPVKCMPPGMSEHITGLAVDVLCENCPIGDIRFGQTAEGVWLRENAHRFGFIIRYPQDKEHITGVQCEPWHLRYVGAEAALYMHENNLCLEEFIALAMSINR